MNKCNCFKEEVNRTFINIRDVKKHQKTSLKLLLHFLSLKDFLHEKIHSEDEKIL